jgi:hypothetical protein
MRLDLYALLDLAGVAMRWRSRQALDRISLGSMSEAAAPTRAPRPILTPGSTKALAGIQDFWFVRYF